jgi:dihydroorotate dehydrogenase (fumarate)
MYSLFEEQIRFEAAELDYFLSRGTESFAEALSYYPDAGAHQTGPEDYLRHVEAAKKAVAIPVIGSLNGISPGGWTKYARRIQDAGADAIELNVYFIPADGKLTGDDIEQLHVDIVAAVKAAVSIPVAVKLSPFFSSTANLAAKLVAAGADGLVLFNRFYQPDIDVTDLAVTPNLVLSDSDDLRLPLRWIAILHGRIEASLAASGGVHTGTDAAKAIMAGADVAMMCSALLKHGPKHVAAVAAELTAVLQKHDYKSVAEMKGVLSQQTCPEPAAFERANYMKALTGYRQLRV